MKRISFFLTAIILCFAVRSLPVRGQIVSYEKLGALKKDSVIKSQLTIDTLSSERAKVLRANSRILDSSGSVVFASLITFDSLSKSMYDSAVSAYTINLRYLCDSVKGKKLPFTLELRDAKHLLARFVVYCKPSANDNPATPKKDNFEVREKALEEIKPLIGNFSPMFRFISAWMFSGDVSNNFRQARVCLTDKQDSKLPGEHIWQYDAASNNYDLLQKTKKRYDKCDTCIHCPVCDICRDTRYVEYYRKRNSQFFSPPVGSQFKVEVINYAGTEPLTVTYGYLDRFLEDEARFQRTLIAFNDNSDKTGAPAGKGPDTAKSGSLQGDETTGSYIIGLRNDLRYYTTHFTLNSFSYPRHLTNVAAIQKAVREVFGTDIQGLIDRYLLKMEKDDELNIVLKQIADYLKFIESRPQPGFAAVRLKNRDYINFQIRDSKGTILKEEELRLRSGLKIDLSTGLILTGLKGFEYILKDTTVSFVSDTAGTIQRRDTSGKFVTRENTGNKNLQFGILTHIYPRMSSNFNVGITAGITTNTNLDINFVLGGGIFLGSQRRFVLSGGWIWGKVDRLSNSVNENYRERVNPATGQAQPVFIPASITVVPVVKQWQSSWFCSASWNFTAK